MALLDWGWAIANQPLVMPLLAKEPTTWDVPKLGAGVATEPLPAAAAAVEELVRISPLSMYLSCRGACSMTDAVAKA